jgi:hypothetical protein
MGIGEIVCVNIMIRDSKVCTCTICRKYLQSLGEKMDIEVKGMISQLSTVQVSDDSK